jgi:dual specificity protein kinase YAK1
MSSLRRLQTSNSAFEPPLRPSLETCVCLVESAQLLLKKQTLRLLDTMRLCNAEFGYDKDSNPRRILTRPPTKALGSEWDNESGDLVLSVGDILVDEEDKDMNRFRVVDMLGQGTFGQVVKCISQRSGHEFAVKVIKNKTAYLNQAYVEIQILRKVEF